MVDARIDREFVDALQLRNRQLEAEKSILSAENLLQKQQLEVCHEKYGEKCHVPWTKPDVCIPIPPSARVPSSVFNLTSRFYIQLQFLDILLMHYRVG